MFSDLRFRLRALFRRRSVERELGDELQFHLERAADAHRRQGLSAGDARRRALAELGGLETTREACRSARGTAGFEHTVQDLRYAVRVLRKHPGFTAGVVLTLGLGVGATTTMFSVVDGVLLRELPYPEADRIVQIGRTFGPVEVSATSGPDYLDLAARTRTFTRVAAARRESVDLTGVGAPERLAGASVSASYFDLLGAAPAAGRLFSAAHDRSDASTVAVLSHGLWQRRFAADPAVVGREITLNGVAHIVLGIAPRRFRGPDALDLAAVDVFLPLGRLRLARADRDDAAFATLATVAPELSLAAARAELDALGRSISSAAGGDGGPRFWMTPLRDRTVGDAGAQLWLLFGAVAVLLLIACTNIANLFLVRATERAREMALRTAIGASRGRIARQLLTESVLFALTGGALGIALAFAGVGAVRAWAPAELPRVSELAVDARVLLFTIALSAAAGIVFGLVPAIDAMRAAPGASLRGASTTVTASRSRLRLRGALVVVQTTFAIVLITGAALLANSVWRLSRVAPGFDPRHVVWLDVSLPERVYPGPAPKAIFFDELIGRAAALPGVVAASAIMGRPLGGGNAVSTVAPEGALPAEGASPPRAPYHIVAPGYFRTMSIAQLDGRDFTAGDTTAAPRVAVVNRAFAERFWPGARAVGKRFWMGRVAADAPLTEIIGVVENVRQYALGEPPIPMVYRPLAQVPRGALSVVVRHDGRSAAGIVQQLREAAWTIDSALPLSAGGTMDAQVWSSIREPRFRALALAVFSAVAAAIAFVGLYATLAWVVRARQRELGIRLVIGADVSQIRGLVIRRGLMLAAIGVATGLVIAALAADLLSSMVFGISPTDLPTFAVSGAGMLALAIVACWIPARRAASVSPVEILRGD
jgi:putative ABC transport system permease protein